MGIVFFLEVKSFVLGRYNIYFRIDFWLFY